MIYFSLEDYFFNIKPFKRWLFLIVLFLILSSYGFLKFLDIKNNKKIANKKKENRNIIIKKLQAKITKAENKINETDLLSYTKSFSKVSDTNNNSEQQFNFIIDYQDLIILLEKLSKVNNSIKKITIIVDENRKINMELVYD
jgi:hypothetical protein